MRSRPALSVSFPAKARPGKQLVVDIELTSTSRTPVDGIDVTLRGIEARRTHPLGSSSFEEEHEHVSLVTRLPGATLDVGKSRSRVVFTLPTRAPPTFTSPITRIAYEIEVNVDIPWWPDRYARYALIVLPTREPGSMKRTPIVATSGPGSGVEVSYQDARIVPGKDWEGAASVQGLGDDAVQKVVLALVAFDRARGMSAFPMEEVRRWEHTVHEGPLEPGATLRFSERFAKGITPTFTGHFMQLDYVIELRVVLARRADLVVRSPVKVLTAGTAAPKKRAAQRLPAVGAARRAGVWAQVAKQAGLTSTPEAERMSGRVGRVALSLRVEERRELGLWTVAHLEWPDLGIDVQVTERRWYEWRGGSVALADSSARGRFSVRARESAQARALLDSGLAEALLPFAEASLGDDGCVVASPGGAITAVELALFVSRAMHLAKAADEAAKEIPPPAEMAAFATAWLEFAKSVGGVLEAGAPRIAGGAVEGEPVEIVTCWESGVIVATELAVLRADPEPRGDVAPPEEVRALLATHDATCVASGEHLVARVDHRLDDPARLGSLLSALARWSRSLRGLDPQGPFR